MGGGVGILVRGNGDFLGGKGGEGDRIGEDGEDMKSSKSSNDGCDMCFAELTTRSENSGRFEDCGEKLVS